LASGGSLRRRMIINRCFVQQDPGLFADKGVADEVSRAEEVS
jgi:hypothetical protein